MASKIIKVRDFDGVIQYADLEDIPPESATVLQNMRRVPGKLVKCSEMGLLVDTLLSLFEKTPTGFTTWIHPQLTQSGTGYAYLAVFVDDTTKRMNGYVWNATAEEWQLLSTVFTGIPFASSPYYYQTKGAAGTVYIDQQNPILQNNDILRLLPGYTAKPDGTNVAVGAWIGWINRNFFDGLYLASTYTAKFCGYPREIDKPSITFTFAQEHGDNAFSPSETMSIVDMNDIEQTITIAGIYPGAFYPGKLFTLHGNSQNIGTFKVESVEEFGELVQTKLWLDDSYHAVVDHIGGYIRATATKESRYYKFSYVYDGIQESLLSDVYKIDFSDMRFLHGTFSITKTAHNKRITALKVYRSTTGEAGTFRLVSTIDFLRESGKYKSGTSGCYTGERAIYIPTLTGVAAAGKVKLWNSNTQGYVEYTNSTYSTSSGGTIFMANADITEDDYWDVAWQYAANGTDYTVTGTGAYAGRRVMVIGESLGSYSYSGGVVRYPVAGTNYYRAVDASYLRALHLTADVIAASYGPDNSAWRLCRLEDGQFFTTDGTSVTFDFFDNDLPEGEAHPLEGEVSVSVNGHYALMNSGRLWQGKIVLDPANKAEQHPDWVAYSELDQPDVTPVSNVLRFQDREGGEITGLSELWGLLVVLKKQAIFTINAKSSPNDPASWTVTESIHNVGNVAPQGFVRAGDDLYVCAYDGIYRIRPNNLAATDATPTAKLKITDPIDNIYNAMTQAYKESIRGVYHQRRNEIHWYMTYPIDEVTTNTHWAYNIITGAWREIDMAYPPRFLALDENANAIALERGDSSTTFDISAVETNQDDCRFTMRSKVFVISEERAEPIHKIRVIYKSPHALLLNLYIDGNETPVTFDLPAQATALPYTIMAGYRAMRVQLEITDDTGTALVAEETDAGPVYLIVEQGALSPNVEISGFDIEHG